MKKLIPLAICLLATFTSLAQKIEYSLQLNSGLSAFRGSAATSQSIIYERTPSSGNYFTDNPYGSKREWGYGASADVKFVTKNNILFGIQAGYQVLRSRVDLAVENRLFQLDYTTLAYYAYTPSIGGYSSLSSSYIVASPYIGYRVNVKKFAFDLTPGLDVALGVHANERGQTVTNETPPTTITVNSTRNTPPTDVRLRCDLKAYYGKFGVYGGYAHSTKNQSADLDPYTTDGTTSAHINMITLGISYRIK